MNPTESFSNLDQESRSALVGYFQLLLKVEQRLVSTQEPASENCLDHHPTGCLDKLCFQLPNIIPREDLCVRLRKASIEFQPTKLNDRRWHLHIGKPDSGVYAYLGHCNSMGIHRFTTRPSAFTSHSKYLQYIQSFLTPAELETAKISRLDLAVDYPEPFKTVIRGFDVLWKKHRTMHQVASITGITVGTGQEKIVVYDKELEAKLSTPLTRLEFQLTGRKLPISAFSSLPKLPEYIKRSNPFKIISLNQIHLPDADSQLNEVAKNRLNELWTLLEHQGYLFAKKELNNSRNFERDFMPFIELKPWQPSPAEAIETAIAAFFNPALERSATNGSDRKED